jgi:acyl carrier protein
MEREEIIVKMKSILEDAILHYEIKELQNDEPIGDGGLNLDSLNFLKFLTAVEKTFGIHIQDELWENNANGSLTSIINYVESTLTTHEKALK